MFFFKADHDKLTPALAISFVAYFGSILYKIKNLYDSISFYKFVEINNNLNNLE